ncbi:MAG: M20/M25/M40 family metallo-hydrolase [Terracidiphilus sp.]|nr:M20/M25/M40 family metallo-hydrolase [Terracidiphilus sp.]
MNVIAEAQQSHQPIDPIRLTRQLCEIESTTYHEGKIGDFLESYLRQIGWQVEKTPVPQLELHDGPRWNIFAAIPGKTPEVVFSTHMDTVPPYIQFSEDEEFLYGRGVCDAKGILAAQIAASCRLRESGCNVGVLFVSGEERDSAGAIAANQHPKPVRYLINGEPTGNRLALASKGSIRVTLKAHGKMAHSAYPELGDSAIHKLVRALGRILDAKWPTDATAGDTTVNIGQIQGGHAPNVIADSAEAELHFRLVTDSEPVCEKILETVKGLVEVRFGLQIDFVRLKAVEGFPTMIAKFTTDIPKLANWGEPLLIGPGSIHVAHSPGEKISKQDLLHAVELYVQLGQQLLK